MSVKNIKKVLMCEPRYFSVDYKINPWMKIGSVNRLKAMSQWQKLVKVLEDQNVKVERFMQKEGLPDMVFVADQAIVKDNNLVLSNFRHKERQAETSEYFQLFKKQRFTIHKLPKNCFFEGGGESVWLHDKLFVGTGFRSSPQVHKYLSKFLDVEVILLELINQYFYHLDTCLFVLNTETAFYYPAAFSKKSVGMLKKMVPNLISIEQSEAKNFGANNIVTGKCVIGQTGNKKFSGEIKKLGYKMIELDMSEFMKAGGGIHCLVQILEERVE